MLAFSKFKAKVLADHPDVGAVTTTPVELDENVTLGYVRFDKERSSPYEDPFRIANIRYSKKLNRCWRRFVCCKELMHVFDAMDAKTDSATKFTQLLLELETEPLSKDLSPMGKSERMAQWMALCVLCPKPRRDRFKADLAANKFTPYEVALALRIPENVINALKGDYYDTVLAELLAE